MDKKRMEKENVFPSEDVTTSTLQFTSGYLETTLGEDSEELNKLKKNLEESKTVRLDGSEEEDEDIDEMKIETEDEDEDMENMNMEVDDDVTATLVSTSETVENSTTSTSTYDSDADMTMRPTSNYIDDVTTSTSVERTTESIEDTLPESSKIFSDTEDLSMSTSQQPEVTTLPMLVLNRASSVRTTASTSDTTEKDLLLSAPRYEWDQEVPTFTEEEVRF